jgi:dsRNA-specific ribonuclease
VNHESGKLTTLKSKIVSNRNLYRCANQLDIAPYILSVNFNSANFMPYQYQKEWLQMKGKDCTKAELSEKTLADVIEALLGTGLLSHGHLPENDLFKLCWKEFLLKMDILHPVSNGIHEPYPDIRIQREKGLKSSFKKNEPQIIRYLQGLLKREFQFPHLLLECVTHPSFRDTDATCYQILEFLGDAVLDFVVVWYLFEWDKNRSLTPGDLTDIRAYIVCNNMLARVAVDLQLHKWLRFHSPDLGNDIKEYLSATKSQVDAPKVLGDLVEALIGAIFVETDGDFQIVKEYIHLWIIRPYLIPVLQKSRDSIYTVYRNPVSILQETIMGLGCKEFHCIVSSIQINDVPRPREEEEEEEKISFNLITTVYECTLHFHGRLLGKGRGAGKKAAKQALARSIVNEEYDTFISNLQKQCSCKKEEKKEENEEGEKEEEEEEEEK